MRVGLITPPIPGCSTYVICLEAQKIRLIRKLHPNELSSLLQKQGYQLLMMFNYNLQIVRFWHKHLSFSSEHFTLSIVLVCPRYFTHLLPSFASHMSLPATAGCSRIKAVLKSLRQSLSSVEESIRVTPATLRQ